MVACPSAGRENVTSHVVLFTFCSTEDAKKPPTDAQGNQPSAWLKKSKLFDMHLLFLNKGPMQKDVCGCQTVLACVL